ncbi:Hsp20/alpha crystallin family protein [Flavobacterium luteum]|uniref:Hsp20/alpha crystallin family protein n=1 Tax=Flavobacterium luteum TaxID=2026654 RepID=A0A7J5AJ21_9FLAO|nr:Hsp20/alpha crystallin family protein [Flavobacterium luteum]KAB1157612.1 Hsp20/alpha crystallin family protein [Flavobacterium luteum]
MSLVIPKRRSERLFPSLIGDFFNNDRLLLDFNGDLFNSNFLEVVPEANIIENNKEYQIELAAPGLERKDFKVEVNNDVLSISAEKEEESKKEDKNYRTREFSYNSFYRSFALPQNLVTDKIDAKYENGILKLVLPKMEVSVQKPLKKIKVA